MFGTDSIKINFYKNYMPLLNNKEFRGSNKFDWGILCIPQSNKVRQSKKNVMPFFV
jgi:hypothetical protein